MTTTDTPTKPLKTWDGDWDSTLTVPMGLVPCTWPEHDEWCGATALPTLVPPRTHYNLWQGTGVDLRNWWTWADLGRTGRRKGRKLGGAMPVLHFDATNPPTSMPPCREGGPRARTKASARPHFERKDFEPRAWHAPLSRGTTLGPSDRPQAHGGVIAFQGRSHRDWGWTTGL